MYEICDTKKYMYHREMFRCHHPGWDLQELGYMNRADKVYVKLLYRAPRPQPSTKAMKVDKTEMKAGSAMTASCAEEAVAASAGLKPKDVKGAVEGVLAIAAEQIKKRGSFKLAGMLNFELKVEPPTKARKGVKAKPASKTVEVQVMPKLKKLIGKPASTTVEVQVMKKLKKLINGASLISE